MATRISKSGRRKQPRRLTQQMQVKPAPSELPQCQPVKLSEDQIRQNAYFGWEAAGRPIGDGVCFWLEAERQLLKSKQPEIC